MAKIAVLVDVYPALFSKELELVDQRISRMMQDDNELLFTV